MRIRWIAAAAALIVAGCGGPKSDEGSKGATASGQKAEVEVAAFQGGYGIDFYEQAAKEFQEKHPELTVKVWGNPRVWEQLRPRFIGGDPPDLTFPGWGMDHWALAEEGQILDLSGVLDTPAAEGNTTWRETFEPSILKLGQLDGKQFVLPYYMMIYGWWYDPAVFAKHGWTPPKTWDELMALAPKIVAAGMAPVTFQGKYPYYMIDGMLLPWASSVGGPGAVADAQNLKPGAWKSPAMLKSAQMIRELADKGYFQEGAVGMSHTEAQQEFLQGHAAMVPCGSWLFSEMKNVMPPTAKMEFMLPPTVAGGTGDPSAVLIGIEPWMVPSAAKHGKEAVELFKYMTSLSKAKQFVEEKGTLMAIKGSDQAKLPEVLKKPAEAFKASNQVWAIQYRQWYPAFNKEIENALTALVSKTITPEQFCDRVEAEAEKTRKDSTIKKHQI